VAQLPFPGRSGDAESVLTDGVAFALADLPDQPRRALRRLADAGHEAVLVGGCLRDLLLGEIPGDWDVATSAPPDQVVGLFDRAIWENRFGTVLLPGTPAVEITTYRSETGYADRRRPDEVTFHGSLTADLERRDFTINAIAWRPDVPGASTGELVDPFGGVADLRAGRIRAVGRPEDRFGEDALRVLRGVRFGLRFGFETEPATEAALVAAVPSTAGLSGERVRDELLRLLGDARITPSVGLLRWESIGLLAVLMPELAALRGVAQDKARGGDALDHSVWTADALPAARPILRLAGLIHDIGKAATEGGGHFIGHEVVGAEMAEGMLRRLRIGTRDIVSVAHLVRQHMFGYDATWTDAAVRRFIGRVGEPALEDLFALREADNAASGAAEPTSGGLDELRVRIAAQRESPMAQRHLAVDGNDLQEELGLAPGPRIGVILDRLLEAVIDDPGLNDRGTLLDMARDLPDTR
jgi:tRNA nucleotidyltransferase (CCA-adding enzyme)